MNLQELSSKFNLSTGFFPVIISMLLCLWTTTATALFAGTVTGLLCLFCQRYEKGVRIPPLLLLGSTGILLLLSSVLLATGYVYPPLLAPFTLEGICMILPNILLIGESLHARVKKLSKEERSRFIQGQEALAVSSRIALIIIGIHYFLMLPIIWFFWDELMASETLTLLLFYLIPPTVLIAAIAFNQFGIYYFNRQIHHELYIPVVTPNGDVTGKVPATEVFSGHSRQLHPVLRIAFVTNGMLYLAPRPRHLEVEKGRTDLLIEGHLLFGETLAQGVTRLLMERMPYVSLKGLRYRFHYPLQTTTSNRLIYLFTFELEEEKAVLYRAFTGCKLWTLRQIEQNIGKEYFSCFLEQEFERLKRLISRPSSDV